MTNPLNWPELVNETLRRRREEGLTQKEHAALAGVSIPTIISFERKETRITLRKALDILNVVGMVSDEEEVNSQNYFVESAERRWLELVSKLPIDSPARQPSGHYTIDYEISHIREHSINHLLEALKVADHKYTGWPPFWIPSRKEIAPYTINNGIECWLGNPDVNHALFDSAHSDYWQATLEPRLYLRRGYEEDAADALPIETVFDLTLPIWRTGEALLHAYHLALALDAPDESLVKFRVCYNRLAGREIKSWANPYREVYENYRCRIGTAKSEIAHSAKDINDNLVSIIHSLLHPIFSSFDFFDLPLILVEEELEKLRKRKKR